MGNWTLRIEDFAASDGGSLASWTLVLADEDGFPQDCPQPSACCFEDGTCQDLLESRCADAGGVAWLEGVPCADMPCVPTGACCLNGFCFGDVTQENCETLGGQWQGAVGKTEADSLP